MKRVWVIFLIPLAYLHAPCGVRADKQTKSIDRHPLIILRLLLG